MTGAMGKSRAILVFSVMVGFLFGASSITHAQVYGVWSNPTPVAPGAYRVGGHFLVGDLVGIAGHLRTGINDKADLGVQIGLPDFDMDFAVAGDVRYRMMSATEGFPMDLAAEVGLGWWKIGEGNADVSIFDVTFGAIASREVQTQSGFVLVPYGTFMLDIQRRSADVTLLVGGQTQTRSVSDTEFGVKFGFGADIPVNDVLSVNGELDISTATATAVYATFGAGYHF